MTVNELTADAARKAVDDAYLTVAESALSVTLNSTHDLISYGTHRAAYGSRLDWKENTCLGVVDTVDQGQQDADG